MSDKILMRPTECPSDSLQSCILFSPKDWNLDKRDAWMYGIIVGWDECIDEVCEKHKWNDADKARLMRLHEKFIATKE